MYIKNDCDGIHTIHESHLGQAKVSELDVTHQRDQQTTATKTRKKQSFKRAIVISSVPKYIVPCQNILQQQ